MSFSTYSVTTSSSSALRTLSVVNGGSRTHRMRTCRELPPSLHGWLLQYWAIEVPITSSLGPGYNRRPSTAIQPCSQCRTECTSLSAGQGKTQRHSTINPQSKHGTHGFRGSTRECPLQLTRCNSHTSYECTILSSHRDVSCSPVHKHQSPCYHKYQTPSNINRKHTCISKSNQTMQAM